MFLGDTFEGKEHDKTILESEDIRFIKPVNVFLDLAYLSLEIENMSTYIPHKKPKGKELTAEQKEENKEKSKIRVGVEHCISGIKRIHILKHKLRVKKYEQHDILILLGCGLHNFRIKNRKKCITN